jgi:hypothetical protein
MVEERCMVVAKQWDELAKQHMVVECVAKE